MTPSKNVTGLGGRLVLWYSPQFGRVNAPLYRLLMSQFRRAATGSAAMQALGLVSRAALELDETVDRLTALNLRSDDLPLIDDSLALYDLAQRRLEDLLWSIEVHDGQTLKPIPLHASQSNMLDTSKSDRVMTR